MTSNPLKDDWICLVVKDLEKIGFSIIYEERLSNLDNKKTNSRLSSKKNHAIINIPIRKYEKLASKSQIHSP